MNECNNEMCVCVDGMYFDFLSHLDWMRVSHSALWRYTDVCVCMYVCVRVFVWHLVLCVCVQSVDAGEGRINAVCLVILRCLPQTQVMWPEVITAKAESLHHWWANPCGSPTSHRLLHVCSLLPLLKRHKELSNVMMFSAHLFHVYLISLFDNNYSTF